MKPHPRIRKTIKWGGAALTVLLVVVLIGSEWWTIGWRGGFSSKFGATCGHFVICSELDGNVEWRDARWAGERAEGWQLWRPLWYHRGDYWFLCVPLCVPFVLSLGITALAFRLDTLARRRARIGLCRNCHYNRTGIPPTALCPECGTPPTGFQSTKTPTATDAPDDPR